MSLRLRLYDDTKHVNLQGRQYKLFNFDLGEGIIRDHLMLGLIVCAGWALLRWLAPSLSIRFSTSRPPS